MKDFSNAVAPPSPAGRGLKSLNLRWNFWLILVRCKLFMQVTKAVIPAAGLGTRLQPVTQILPKELLPIVTTPSLHLGLAELVKSGLKEVLLIVSPNKKEYFFHLEEFFPTLKFHFVIQEKPLGLGHAVSLSEKFVGAEPFLLLLPDDLIDHEKPAGLQLMEAFQKTKKSINAAAKVSKEQFSLYGIYDVVSSQGRLHLARGVVEKPSPSEAPSSLAVIGRYLFTPEIFGILKKTLPGRNGEIQLADAMNALAAQEGLYAFEFEGNHFDIGTPAGWIRANLYYGIKEYGKSIYQGLI